MRVAILGCGYVGLELGRQLTEAGHEAVGVRRSEAGIAAIEDAGFDAVQADVTDPDSLSAVPDVDAVVFAASSGGGDAEQARAVYVDGLRTVVDHFGGRESVPDRLLYTSSTGVHGDHDGDWVDSTTPVEPATPKAAVLAEAERVALDAPQTDGMDGTVARLAGLYGPDRYRLSRYLDGPVTEGYLNLLHRDDAAGAIRWLLTADACRRQVVQLVDDEPVSKWEFADWLADQCGRDPPPKRTTAERLADDDLSERARRRLLTSKRCANDRLVTTGYEFTYPTYRDGYRAAIESRLS
ncbi:NAD-dependent epimerase/dehydratase [Halovivax asiaticus JCM 14624]|uniref:NAD-dependent epimerase/dehydratase n=1 Tax=Halovivax asiaticus JCM 14624 TaxID=1227490 RepID=M0BVI1_9EURY|nr:SDR family oxidoreductase [Halovivax asiaticus]ELZ13674.1 NAD-dependent epimerase/dehydratase [Halovivax asiaticus JCM 14624]